jgi:hypothetical protein
MLGVRTWWSSSTDARQLTPGIAVSAVLDFLKVTRSVVDQWSKAVFEFVEQ